MDDNAIVQRISQRQQQLRDASVELKSHFVGLDEVIDKILLGIEAWFCTPEVVTRPTVVCLWGLTGIGKTDLVRRLVKSLNFMDSFVEIQMTNKGSSQNTYASTLQSLLSGSNVCPEEPGVLLLDEIQRFRSVDQEGKDIHDYMFQDLWMLLSDGSFGSASDNKQQLIELLMEAIYWEDYHNAKKASKKAKEEGDDEEDEEEETNKEIESRRKFKQTYWHAKQLKRKLRLTESVEEIMKWDARRKTEMLEAKLQDKSIYKPEVFGKLLIFISGNLDEAYKMADQTEEADIDADVFHKHSQRINLISVKSALKERFKPEQIARFGNTHVIYPALSKASYEEIIRRKVAEVINNVEANSGVRFECDASIYEAIYRNGVFPVQGTRPVFSTVASFFESLLPTFTLKCLKSRVMSAKMFYENKSLYARIGGETVSVRNEGDIDKIKEDKRHSDLMRKVAVHESGHAVAYAALFHHAPTQVAALLASEDKLGFVGMHAIEQSYTFMLYQIRCLLAGKAAEEVMFGRENVSGGCVADIDKATSTAASMIRLYGMGKVLSRMDVPSGHAAVFHNLDLDQSNKDIELLLQQEKAEAERLISQHTGLVVELSDLLMEQEKVSGERFVEVCEKHNLFCTVLDAKEVIYPKYSDIYEGKTKRLKRKR